MTVSRSPGRNSFQRDAYIQRCEAEGKEPREDYLKLFESYAQMDIDWAANPEAHTNDMEWDLRTTPWILQKVRSSNTYAQNLYAAMCNMRFQRYDIIPILKDEYWSCSWRSAGGIIADMQQKGDYIDWYCSGIRNDMSDVGDTTYDSNAYVPEGTVTEEIERDLFILGWVPSPWPDDDGV